MISFFILRENTCTFVSASALNTWVGMEKKMEFKAKPMIRREICQDV